MGVGSSLSRESYPIFEPIGGICALKRCRENAQNLDREILKRGVGRAFAIELGLKFSAHAGASKPELFHQGLGRACDRAERKRVAKVVREWVDGNSVAAHYGFGIDLFCSEDFRRSTSGPSVLDFDSRNWLREEFGIQFVTLAELAARMVK
jgi:hypothetical protein